MTNCCHSAYLGARTRNTPLRLRLYNTNSWLKYSICESINQPLSQFYLTNCQYVQVNNETIVLDDTADANESRTSSPCSIIEILSPADDVVEVHRCVAPPSNIQSIAAKYYTPPSMDFIPLSSNRGGGQIRPTWAQVAQAQGSRRARPAHAPRESERLQRGRARARGRPTGGQSDACATRFSAASGRRPDLQFGGVIGPPPRGDNVFRFTGRGGSNAVAEPTATMYSGKRV